MRRVVHYIQTARESREREIVQRGTRGKELEKAYENNVLWEIRRHNNVDDVVDEFRLHGAIGASGC